MADQPAGEVWVDSGIHPEYGGMVRLHVCGARPFVLYPAAARKVGAELIMAAATAPLDEAIVKLLTNEGRSQAEALEFLNFAGAAAGLRDEKAQPPDQPRWSPTDP